jgi:hypothetical protein
MDGFDAFKTLMSLFHFAYIRLKPRVPFSRADGYHSSVLDLTVCGAPPPEISCLSDLKGFLSVEDLSLQFFLVEELYSKVLSFLSFVLFEDTTSYSRLAFEDLE